MNPKTSPSTQKRAASFADWTMHQSSNVLFSDESRISLICPDGHHRVYRRQNERFSPCTIVEMVGFQSGSIMLWGGISYEARTDLVRGAINALRYLEAVLEPHVIPFAPFIGEDFLLMQDNARPHVARIVTAYLLSADVKWLSCKNDIFLISCFFFYKNKYSF